MLMLIRCTMRVSTYPYKVGLVFCCAPWLIATSFLTGTACGETGEGLHHVSACPPAN